MEMSNSNDQRDIPVAYPPPPATKPTYVMAPSPIGYPMKDDYDQEGNSKHRTIPAETSTMPAETRSRGESFWKGCVAAICCCWVLDFCFGC